MCIRDRHSDYAASRITEPFPEFCVLTVAVWAIDDFQAEHGPTVILPGSYRKRSQVPPGTTQEGAVKIEMKQGSIAMWNGATWHGSTPRTAPGKRTSLHNTYCRNYLRPLESYLSIDPAIVRRNPPAFSSLCGLDDALWQERRGRCRFRAPDLRGTRRVCRVQCAGHLEDLSAAARGASVFITGSGKPLYSDARPGSSCPGRAVRRGHRGPSDPATSAGGAESARQCPRRLHRTHHGTPG